MQPSLLRENRGSGPARSPQPGPDVPQTTAFIQRQRLQDTPLRDRMPREPWLEGSPNRNVEPVEWEQTGATGSEPTRPSQAELLPEGPLESEEQDQTGDPGLAQRFLEDGVREQVNTTVFIRCFPGPFAKSFLFTLWPPDGSYNYMEIPFRASSGSFKGHVVINFVSAALAHQFFENWHGQYVHRTQPFPLNVTYSFIQGLPALLERFRSKDINRLAKHGHLPMLFHGTERVDFKYVARLLFNEQ